MPSDFASARPNSAIYWIAVTESSPDIPDQTRQYKIYTTGNESIRRARARLANELSNRYGGRIVLPNWVGADAGRTLIISRPGTQLPLGFVPFDPSSPHVDAATIALLEEVYSPYNIPISTDAPAFYAEALRTGRVPFGLWGRLLDVMIDDVSEEAIRRSGEPSAINDLTSMVTLNTRIYVPRDAVMPPFNRLLPAPIIPSEFGATPQTIRSVRKNGVGGSEYQQVSTVGSKSGDDDTDISSLGMTTSTALSLGAAAGVVGTLGIAALLRARST